MYKYIAIFKVKDSLKYLSHLELMRLFRQIFIRLNLQINFTKGFSPHMKISFCLAKPVGLESIGELLELEFKKKYSSKELIRDINRNLPKEIKLIKCKIKKKEIEKSLSSLLKKAEYCILLSCRNNNITKVFLSKIKEYFNQDKINIKVNKKQDVVIQNIKKDILSWSLFNKKKYLELRVILKHNNEKSVRCKELIDDLLEKNLFKCEYKLIRISLQGENKYLYDNF